MNHSSPNSSLNRRSFVGGTMAASVLAGAVRGAVSAQATPSASPAPAFPRSIAHALGETTIPEQPTRIVAVTDFIDLDYLLVLDITPVLYGFTNAWDSGAMPWQTAAATSDSYDASGGTTDLELIAAAKPDLIVAMISQEDIYPILSEIAPTVVLGWDTEWRSGLRLIGAATGRDDLANARIAEAEEQIAAAKIELESIAEKQLMVAFEYADTFYIWGDEVAAAHLFRDLGLNFVGGAEPQLQSVSLEQVNLLQDAEILLSMNSDPAGIAMQEASPLFQGLPVVQNGGYEVLTVVQGRAFGDSLSPLSVPWILPQLVEVLLRLGDGGGKSLT